MVRLEKQIYEQVLNIHLLKRGRTIQAPSKWYTENRTDAFQVAAQRLCLEGITGKIFGWLEPLITKYTYNWYRDIAYQRGLAMEDLFLHQDRELRHCHLWEKMVRDSCHPYQHIFFKKRRGRYYKIERGVRGFYVPDYIRQEAENRLFADTAENKQEWEDHVYSEYMSDMTPNFRWSILTKWTVLDLFVPHGLWRGEAWDRYFQNEKFYEEITQNDVEESFAKVFPQDLSSVDGRRDFEESVNRFIALYPGSIVRDGEQFDFQRFYAKHALLHGNELNNIDAALLEDLKKELQADSVGLIEGDAPQTGSGKSIGSLVPKWVQPASGKGYFAN